VKQILIVQNGFPGIPVIMRHEIYGRASLLLPGEGHDCMDAGGRATQEAKAEDEGINKIKALAFRSPHPNPLPVGEGE
jgi:hypothetical protein